MSYDRQEATEQPTDRRLTRAREEGKVARSGDFSSSVLSLDAIGFALYWFPQMLVAVEGLLSTGFSFSTEDPNLLLMQSGVFLLQILLLPCLVLFAAAVFAGVIQVGGLFAPTAAKVDPSRVHPGSGWILLWGGHGWMNLLFSCCKLTAAVIAAGAVGWSYKNELLSPSGGELMAELSTVGTIAGKMVFASAGSLFVLGVLDVVWQRYLWKSRLKMTRQEVITEQKEQQGNAKIRQTVPFDHYASERIPPSLVLVGKTIAISIRWNPTTMTSPVVLAFIREDEIDSITEKAKLQKIPVEVNYWLCSRVEQSCDIGTAVPPSLHSEIASVLTRGRRKIA